MQDPLLHNRQLRRISNKDKRYRISIEFLNRGIKRSNLLFDELDEFCPYLIPNASENLQNIVVISASFGRIVKTPMHTSYFAREDGAGLVGVIANSYDEVEGRAQKFVETF